MSSKLRQWGHLHLYSVCNYNKKSGSRLHTAEWSNAGKSYLIMKDLRKKMHFAPISKSLLMFLDASFDGTQNWTSLQAIVLPTLHNLIHESPAGKYSIFVEYEIEIFADEHWKTDTNWNQIEAELLKGLDIFRDSGPDHPQLIFYRIRLEPDPHATVLCLNRFLYTIEYIDSNGDPPSSYQYSSKNQAIQNLLDMCKKLFPEYRVLSFADTCPRIDIQRLDQNDESVAAFGVQSSMPKNSAFIGTCFFWSLWYMYIRAQHPKVYPKEIMSNAFEEALQADVTTSASADPDDLDLYGPTRLESFIIAFLRMLYLHSDLKVQFKIRNPDMVYYPSPEEVID